MIGSLLNVGVGEEAIEPHEGDQGAEARAQHLRRRERRSPHPCVKGRAFSLDTFVVSYNLYPLRCLAHDLVVIKLV